MSIIECIGGKFGILLWSKGKICKNG